MAHEWVVADSMFQSQLDESFVAHQYIIAAQAHSSVDLPVLALWGCGGGSSDVRRYDHARTATIRPASERPVSITRRSATSSTRRSSRGASTPARTAAPRAATAATWSGYQAVKHIFYGPDWKKDVISPNWKFITDVRAGKLANFTWITPVCDDSDHVNCPGGYGPSWVSALVNTVGKSKFWDSTAIFVQWDDWGGLYDHVAAAVRGPRWPGLPRSVARDLSVRQARLRFARAVRDGERAALCRRSLRSRSARRGRQARELTGHSIVSTSRRDRARSCRSKRRSRRSSSCTHSGRLLCARLRIGHAGTSASRSLQRIRPVAA